MKTFKEEKVEYVKNVLDKTLCDLCGKEIIKDTYETNEVRIECNVGYSFPGDCSGEVKEFDVCVDCFNEKLVKWFTEQGVTPRTYEY